MNRTCLSYWYPKIQNLVPTPETIILGTDLDCLALAYGEPVNGFDGLITKVHEACQVMGFPAFLRTGLTSAKHDWKDSCFCDKDDHYYIGRHMLRIIEYSAMVDFIGLAANVWAARRMLEVEPIFHAFHGHMPVTKEFRYFVREGEVVHQQPYWPEAALDGHIVIGPSDWRAELARINNPIADDTTALTNMSERVGEALGGYWSIDWLWAENQWWLTDMAEGEKSYRYEP